MIKCSGGVSGWGLVGTGSLWDRADCAAVGSDLGDCEHNAKLADCFRVRPESRGCYLLPTPADPQELEPGLRCGEWTLPQSSLVDWFIECHLIYF